jgi:acyl carrier protein
MENYLASMAELLEVESVSPNDVLADFDCWDSLTVLSIIVYLSETHKKLVTASQITDCKFVVDVYDRFIEKK